MRGVRDDQLSLLIVWTKKNTNILDKKTGTQDLDSTLGVLWVFASGRLLGLGAHLKVARFGNILPGQKSTLSPTTLPPKRTQTNQGSGPSHEKRCHHRAKVRYLRIPTLKAEKKRCASPSTGVQDGMSNSYHLGCRNFLGLRKWRHFHSIILVAIGI